MPNGAIRDDNIRVVCDETYRLPLGDTSTTVENLRAVEVHTAAGNLLSLILWALSGTVDRMSRWFPPNYAPMLTMLALCNAAHDPAVFGPTLQVVVQALAGQVNVFSQDALPRVADQHVLQTICQAYQVHGLTLPGHTRDMIVIALARQADGHRAILDELKQLVRQGHPPGPPINILQGRSLGQYGNTGRSIMTEHYRALDGQGLQPPPPTAVAASGQWRYVGPVHQPDTGTAYLYTYVDGGDAPRRIKREYIDYDEYGSLEGIISRHRQGGLRRAKAIDESFLWQLFRSLTAALRAIDRDMHNPLGALTGVLGHLHCGNVFLGSPNDVSFRIYPTPKIAPFDAVATSLWDVKNWVRSIDHDFELDFAPPELEQVNPLPPRPALGVPHPNCFVHFGPNSAFKALSPANVYQVGVIMICAMRLQNHTASFGHYPEQPLVRGHSTQNYTAVKYHPDHYPINRPTPANLLRQISVDGAAYLGFGASSLEHEWLKDCTKSSGPAYSPLGQGDICLEQIIWSRSAVQKTI
ncbi:hypothetical protein BDV97DRAFT_373925 [Delphinella strobiligena]|nr:hypothetical protein BDV97DRAFT_373925 [Delphinella strobiligena]